MASIIHGKYNIPILCRNVGTGKSRFFMDKRSIINKLRQKERKSLYLCDGKNDELYEVKII